MKKIVGFASFVFCSCLFLNAAAVRGQDNSPSVVARENMEILIKTNSCRECDLRGVNLNRIDLADADLEGADLSRAKLYLTNLSGANLRGSNLQAAGFGGADLANADLRGADLRGASLEGAYTAGALFDGEFITTKPYAAAGVPEIEKEVFVEDPAKPKVSPEAREVNIAKRRDFEETPPILPEKTMAKAVAESQESKELNELQDGAEVAVDEATPALLTAAPQTPTPKTVQPIQEIDVAVAEPPKVKEHAEADIEVVPDDGSEPLDEVSAVVNIEKAALLARFLDTNKCYECDLSGVDFSGSDLEDADLEKADLSGCNLEGADLENANLKGALLLHVNLKNANLERADLYKADLTGADLTGANIVDAIFEETQLYGVEGLNMNAVLLEE